MSLSTSFSFIQDEIFYDSESVTDTMAAHSIALALCLSTQNQLLDMLDDISGMWTAFLLRKLDGVTVLVFDAIRMDGAPDVTGSDVGQELLDHQGTTQTASHSVFMLFLPSGSFFFNYCSLVAQEVTNVKIFLLAGAVAQSSRVIWLAPFFESAIPPVSKKSCDGFLWKHKNNHFEWEYYRLGKYQQARTKY